MTSTEFPKKRDHRQRAHCNPLADSLIAYPLSPNHVDWSLHFPKYFRPDEVTTEGMSQARLFINSDEYPVVYSAEPVESWRHSRSDKSDGVIDIIDLGCGFGGMTIRLAELFPDKLVLGLEIRDKVSNFVGKKIQALRHSVEIAGSKAGAPSATFDDDRVVTAAVPRSADSAAAAVASGCSYQNCAVLRTNAMKFLPNYIRKNSVEKIFILFPDPHFKKSNWRRRIITPQLLSTYAYHLRSEIGRLYFSTDVYDLYQWMKLSCDKHPLFELIEQPEADPAYGAMFDTTDECKKAIRLNQKLYGAVYKRV